MAIRLECDREGCGEQVELTPERFITVGGGQQIVVDDSAENVTLCWAVVKIGEYHDKVLLCPEHARS